MNSRMTCVFVLASIALSLGVSMTASTSERNTTVQLQNNRVFAEFGRFQYGDGKYLLTTAKEPDGKILFSIAQRRRTILGRAAADLLGELHIPSHCDWFISLDEFERVWLFVGPSLEQGQDTMRSPCIVYLYGRTFDANGELHYSIQNIAGTSDGVKVFGTQVWAGVPASFLARVHHQVPAGTQLKAALPELPPEFTAQQMSPIASAVRE